MVAISIACSVALSDRAHAKAAAQWIEAAYADVRVELEPELAIVQLPAHSPGKLRLIWQSGLLNERMVAAARVERAAVLERLTQ